MGAGLPQWDIRQVATAMNGPISLKRLSLRAAPCQGVATFGLGATGGWAEANGWLSAGGAGPARWELRVRSRMGGGWPPRKRTRGLPRLRVYPRRGAGGGQERHELIVAQSAGFADRVEHHGLRLLAPCRASTRGPAGSDCPCGRS